MMNIEEAIKYLYSLGNEALAMKLGLDSIHALARALDDPQRNFPRSTSLEPTAKARRRR